MPGEWKPDASCPQVAYPTGRMKMEPIVVNSPASPERRAPVRGGSNVAWQAGSGSIRGVEQADVAVAGDGYVPGVTPVVRRGSNVVWRAGCGSIGGVEQAHVAVAGDGYAPGVAAVVRGGSNAVWQAGSGSIRGVDGADVAVAGDGYVPGVARAVRGGSDVVWQAGCGSIGGVDGADVAVAGDGHAPGITPAVRGGSHVVWQAGAGSIGGVEQADVAVAGDGHAPGRERFGLLVICLAWLFASGGWAAAEGTREEFEIVISHGHIIDGTGSPWYAADLGIREGRIAAIGNLESAARKRTIEAEGMIVAPGFIDMLGQSEVTILVDPRLPSKIYQGITSEITGEGLSVGPVTEAILQADRADYDYEHFHIAPEWRTVGQYYARLEKQGLGINLGTYVGATQVRRMVLGDENKAPTAAQLEEMKRLVREAMQEGAVGVSTALQYAPAPYASTAELVALASEAAKYGGVYASHIRSEDNDVLAAIDEAVAIGRQARIPVEIWHLKVFGKSNWGRMPEVVAKINAARSEGVDIAADTYAYPASFNTMSAFIPPWAHDGGNAKLIERLKDPATRARIRQDLLTPSSQWNNEWQAIPGPEAVLIGVVQNPKLRPLQGKTLADVAKLWGKDAIDALYDLLIEDEAYPSAALFAMSEPDIALALQQPWVSIDNDSSGTSPEGILGKDHPHPRAYGTFPRILRKYVREEHKLTWEEAIRKFSALPAQRMRLADRGVLKKGLWADVVVFDPVRVRDLATFDNPHQFSEGMEYVLANGVPVIDKGKMTGALPGKVLRGPGYAPLVR
jgi:N-acyl-D-amino-acid deacylase